MTTRERALDASVAQSAAILGAMLGLRSAAPAAAGRALWEELVAHLEGRIGRADLGGVASGDRAAVEEAARALACLDRPLEAFALLVRLDPRQNPGVLGTALRVIPLLAPATLFAERRWVAQLFPALLDSRLRDEIEPLIQALHGRGHFQLIEALRRSKLSAVVPDASWRLLEARQACWSGHYTEIEPLLDAAALPPPRRVEADLLLAISRSRIGKAPDDAELRALIERAAHLPGFDETVERWRPEILLRSGCADRRLVGEALSSASDHIAVRLLYRIIACGEPPKGPSADPTWGFHTYVLEALRDAGMSEAGAALAAAGTSGETASLWCVLDRLGGNRSDVCTFIDAGGVRRIDIRTARQEAVASQALLPVLGAEQTRARLAGLAARYPGLSVFATYQAEILLWEGRYEEAAAGFEKEVREAATRWGEVGLGAALAALGQEDEAERIWARGHRRHSGALPGEATFVYRAEIAVRRGDLQGGSDLLRGVLAAKPTRVRGWLLRSEIAWLQQRNEAARQALMQALALCPGLATTLSAPPAALGELLLTAHDPTPAERDILIDWCRGLRAAMRGNASSWMFTWFDAGGTMCAFRRVPYADLLLALEAVAHIAAAGGRQPGT